MILHEGLLRLEMSVQIDRIDPNRPSRAPPPRAGTHRLGSMGLFLRGNSCFQGQRTAQAVVCRHRHPSPPPLLPAPRWILRRPAVPEAKDRRGSGGSPEAPAGAPPRAMDERQLEGGRLQGPRPRGKSTSNLGVIHTAIIASSSGRVTVMLFFSGRSFETPFDTILRQVACDV